MDNEEVFELAKQAIEKMLEDKGDGYTFPFDEIWKYVPNGIAIPSQSRPHQSRRLLASGYLEKTGGMTRAATPSRAGSATPEYRFGEALVGDVAIKSYDDSEGVGQLLKDLQLAMEAEGYIISPAELTNFYLGLLVSPLVILSGISGTGKSLLPRLFCKLTSSKFFSIPVQPQWSDNSDLMGYVPTLSPETFYEGKMIPPLEFAVDDEECLVVALLDEINLAPVEHYFSDFLSITESRRRQGDDVMTDVLPIELPDIGSSDTDRYSNLRKMRLPSNFRVVGTANLDETTHTFSPKVLDRAFTIEFDYPDITAFPPSHGTGSSTDFSVLAAKVIDKSRFISVHEALPENREMFQQVADILFEIQQILSPSGIRFGYRTRDAVLMYMYHWKLMGCGKVLTHNAALDLCILQKVLPKVHGSGELLLSSLQELAEWLKYSESSGALEFNSPYTRSLQKLERMIDVLESDGVTYYWGI